MYCYGKIAVSSHLLHSALHTDIGRCSNMAIQLQQWKCLLASIPECCCGTHLVERLAHKATFAVNYAIKYAILIIKGWK